VDVAFKALAEPRRREILHMVWSKEMPASHIAARFEDITRSAVSQHLGVLREAELIVERREGTKRLYRANHAEMARLRSFLDGYWTDSLERLRELAEAAETAETAERETAGAQRRRSTQTATDHRHERKEQADG
jgi:DNA-binding transcriptional ArsR family regulator